MSSIDDELESGEEGHSSWEELGHRLYSKKHKEYHTEINQPHAMSVLDTSIRLIKDEFGEDVAKDLNSYRDWFRNNMIAFKRKRAEETTRVATAAAQRETERMQFREKLLGDLVR